eukprot:12272121-Prorocentrum_lima.AAC.1
MESPQYGVLTNSGFGGGHLCRSTTLAAAFHLLVVNGCRPGPGLQMATDVCYPETYLSTQEGES